MKPDLNITGDYFNLWEKKFRVDLFRSFKNTYKSIAKHLKDSLLLKHKSCIKSLIQGFFFEELTPDSICPYAYAYILWRFNIERLDRPDQVDRIKPIRWLRQDIKILPEKEFDFVFNLAYKWLLSFPNNSLYTQLSFEWVFNRLIMILINNSFYNILMNVSNGLIERDISKKSKILRAYFPFFLIVFPDSSKACAEFHWWTSKELDISELGKNLVCPNLSVRKHRKHKCNHYSTIDLFESRPNSYLNNFPIRKRSIL